jgi:hypothetical protein
VCVLLLHHRTRPDWPVVLLANRDEWFDRPFEPPALRDEALGLVAPQDLRAGGTWLGLNRHGVVAAITNRPGEDARPGARSRGLLVRDALEASSARRARDRIAADLACTAYAGFHLMVVDRAEAFVVRHRGAAAPAAPGAGDVLALPPGAHVLTNLHEPDEVTVPPEGGPRVGEAIDDTLRRLERLAADDTPRFPRGHRILKREAHRGTVCSATIAVPARPAAAAVFRFADGPPDRARFCPVAPA